MMIRIQRPLLSVAVVLVLGGCATSSPSPPQAAAPERPVVASSPILPPQSGNRLPLSVDAALLPPLKSPPPTYQQDKKLRNDGPLIDVVVDGLPAKVFFMGLAEKSRINIMVHPEVNGSITLNLAQSTVPQAVETVCKMYNFDCERTDQGYLIQPPRLVLRQYHVDYLRLQRMGTTRTRINAGQEMVSSSSSTDKDKGNTTRTQQVETAGSQVVTQQQSHFWQELVMSLCGVLGLGYNPNDASSNGTAAAGGATEGQSGGKPKTSAGMLAWDWGPQSNTTAMLGCTDHNSEKGRRVVINPQTGDLLIRAYPSELREIEQYLAGQKQTLERQVILEAKILEITLNDGSQTGVNWNLAFGKNSQSNIAVGGGGSLLGNANVNPLFIDTTSSNFSPSGLNDSTASTFFGGAFASRLKVGSFDGILELLKTQGKVQVLSSPRVATLNNQKAVIRVGQDEYFVTEVRSESSSSAAGTERALIPHFTSFFSGIAMDVTPQISDDGHIMLHIHPMVSEVITDQKQLMLGSVVQSYPMPLNRVRETDTMIHAADGEVVVIGGLMKDVEINRKAGVPGLSDVPLVGKLFQQDQESIKKSELVILLRPRIVTGTLSWQQELRRTALSGTDPFAQGSSVRWSERPSAVSGQSVVPPNPGLEVLQDRP
jgi:MSHA biogenesis protein MshL